MPTYPVPAVTFVRGEGSRLYDADGKSYLDFLGGLAVTSLGHAHPAVADAIAEQARTLLHVCNLYGTTPGPEVAATLDRLIDGGGGGKVFFCNSGAEANECAFKLARRWAGPGRYAVVSAYGSFHGRTLATLHATGQPQKHEAFQPLPEGFRHVAFGDIDALDRGRRPERRRRRPARAHPGRGRRQRGAGRVPGRRPPAVRRARRPADHGRGPDRARSHRAVVRVPARRHPARRRHHGQGAGQRDAHRRLLGPGRGGRRLPPRRPRHHLRRPAAGDGRGPGRAEGDGGRGRPRPGRAGRRPPRRRAGRTARRDVGAGHGPAAGRRAGHARRPGRSPPPRSTPASW